MQNNIDIKINLETNNSENKIDKAKKSLDNLSNSSKKANQSVDKLNKSFQQIGSVSQILPNNLKNFASSLANITKVATPIAAVGVSVKAISFGFNEAYKNSEKFRSEIDTLKNSISQIGSVQFKEIGDSLAGIVGKVNEWVEAQSRLNGVIAITNEKQLEAIKNARIEAEEKAKTELQNLEELGATDEEITTRRLNNLRNLQTINEQTYNDAIALQEKYKKDLKEINALLVDLKEKKDNVNIMDLDAVGNNPYEEQFKKAMDTHARLVSQSMELDNKILPSIKEKYKENNEEIQKSTTSIKQTTKVGKDRLQQLREQLAQVKKIRGYENDLNDDNLDNEDEKQRYYERQLQSLNQQKSIVNAIYNEERSRGIVNEKTKADYEELERLIEEIKKKMGKVVEETKTWEDYLRDATQITASIHSTINSLISSAGAFGEKSLASYTKAIDEAQAKITAFNQWKEEQKEEENEQSDEEYEAYLERLDKEYEIAKKVGDKMTMLAIENKKKELAKNKEKLEEDKQITEQEKALEKELAIAEYNKSYAEWQNEVASAKTAKAQAITDAIMMPLVAIGNSAVGISKSFAEGGIIGAIAGTAASIGIIASAVSGAAGVKSASNSYDNVAASPPTPPAFKFGTTGYQLDNGQSAIVGETGAEVIRNMAGKLVVESNAQAKAMGRFNEADMYIEQVIFNVSSIVDKKTIYKAMNEYKQRDSFAYTR